MNLRNFTVFGTVAMLALGGCVIVGSNDTGGNGGAAGNGQGGEGNIGGNTSSSANVGGAGGNMMGACAKFCSDTQTDPTLVPCADASMTTMKLYQELADCVCGDMGLCTAMCKPTTYCGGTQGDGTDEYKACQGCLLDQTMGCGPQVQACSDDM